MSTAARISLIYVVVGSLWIASSDAILQVFLQQNPNLYAVGQTLKGGTFIAFTGVVLYALLRREFKARYRSEQQTREREARFHLLFSSSPLPMWVYDRKTLEFIDVNAASCAQYGYSREEFLTMRITQLRPPEDIPQLMDYLGRTSLNLRYAGEWNHMTKDGKIIPVESWVHSLNFSDRKASLAIIRDLTERKRSEAEQLENERLRLALERESELKTMRNRFMSMVSHEFRRPLTTISTSVELLEAYRSRMTDDSTQKHFNRIHQQIHEMTDLLDDFLALMRSEAGKTDFKPASVDLTALCAKMIDELKLGDKNSHIIGYTTNCASVTVEGDDKLLRQAIGNLLTNAVKYSPEGSTVQLDLNVSEAHIDIRVSDQGLGIPLEDQAHIFDPFFRATNVGERNGTGLGLSIARQSVTAHDGALKLIHSDATGTTFLITLPVHERTILTGC